MYSQMLGLHQIPDIDKRPTSNVLTVLPRNLVYIWYIYIPQVPGLQQIYTRKTRTISNIQQILNLHHLDIWSSPNVQLYPPDAKFTWMYMFTQSLYPGQMYIPDTGSTLNIHKRYWVYTTLVHLRYWDYIKCTFISDTQSTSNVQ